AGEEAAEGVEAHVADDDRREDGDDAGRDHLLERGLGRDVDATRAVRLPGALEEAGDLTELATHLGDHPGGSTADGGHGEGTDEERQDATDEKTDDDRRVDDVEAGLLEPDGAGVGAEE